MCRVVALFLVLALAGGCARVREPTREEVLGRILPSAVQIVIEQREGRRVRTGSGVAVAARRARDRIECLVVTAGHTVSGLVGQNEVYTVFGGHRSNVTKTRATIVAFEDTSELDVALLRTESDRCIPAHVGGAALLGESVWVIGFPWGRHMTLTRGIVSQVALDDGIEQEKPARLMVDAPVSYGSSGGGVFEAREGTLIGVVEGYSTARVTSKGTDPSWYIEVPVPGQTFVTPISDVRRFLARTSVADLLPAGLAEPPGIEFVRPVSR